MQASFKQEEDLQNPFPFRKKGTYPILDALLSSENILSREEVENRIQNFIDYLICLIDKLISSQLNVILHHPNFQKLEATWRGVNYLIHQTPPNSLVKIRLLNVSWKTLAKDVLQGGELDESHFFRKIYEEEFGMPGGEPFGLLIADYYLGIDLPVSREDSILALSAISQIAATAFVPFIMGVSPQFFGLENYTELKLLKNVEQFFETSQFQRWKKFQMEEDSRFVGMTLPYVLMRQPYRSKKEFVNQIQFEEDITLPHLKSYLWGNSCYNFASVIVKAFLESGWFSVITGTFNSGSVNGGLVENLPREEYGTDRWGLLSKPSLDILIAPALERKLSQLGFLSLCGLKNKSLAAYYSCQSVQQVKINNQNTASIDTDLSARFNYLLCISRIAHYLKVIWREKIGSFETSEEIEEYLTQWLLKYTAANEGLSSELMLKYPLRSSQLKVKEISSLPGYYKCILRLQLQSQPDQMEINLHMRVPITS